MKAFRSLLISALALMPAASASARLGDTLAEATARYGVATERKAKLPATLARVFTVGDLTLETDFINDAVHRLTYRRTRAFTAEEIQNLLAENAATYSWLAESDRLDPARAAAGPRAWRRSDRGSAVLTRHTEGQVVTETLVVTDPVWLMANLKLKPAPKPATPATKVPVAPASPESAAVPEAVHSLTWAGYDGVTDPAAAHLVLDGKDLGPGAAGLTALKEELAALPAKAQVKVIPYYGDPGGAAVKKPPLDLAELRTYCEAHGLELLLPQAR